MTVFGVKVGEQVWGPFTSRAAAEKFGVEQTAESGAVFEILSETVPPATPGGVR